MVRAQHFILLFLVISLFSSRQHFTIPPTDGTIAFIRGETEIRLIKPDGTGEKQLWTHPQATKDLGLYNVAWRPDGKELAFSSAHEATTSLYHSDIYAIQPDGSGFRKITNSPAHDKLSKFPKGTVSLTVRNNQFAFQQTQASSGVFMVYVAGAESPQQITLPPGTAKTITFKSVADFGNQVQPVVAMWGKYRWFMPGLDVKAGQIIKAPELGISGDGIDMFGAFLPVWRSDGSQLSYRTGLCTVNSITANPADGTIEQKAMFGGKAPFGSCNWDWGPTSQLADQVIYTENSGDESFIYQMKEGGTHPGKRLTAYSNIQYQLLNDLQWLPDGSGLLYSTPNLMRESSNIFLFDFKSQKTKQVTGLSNAFARNFCVSPDGEWIVYERCKSLDDYKNVDIWIVRMNGKEDHLLVRNGLDPSWGK